MGALNIRESISFIWERRYLDLMKKDEFFKKHCNVQIISRIPAGWQSLIVVASAPYLLRF